jgi:large subunit ribosomal protein L17
MISSRKFARTTGRRRAFRKQLAQSLIMYGEIITTEARAKDIRPLVERYVTYAKTGQTAKLRMLLAVLPKQAAEKLFYEIAPKYKTRTGGYLSISKHAVQRMRDGTKMATIKFVK